jgi:hypothetical protein
MEHVLSYKAYEIFWHSSHKKLQQRQNNLLSEAALMLGSGSLPPACVLVEMIFLNKVALIIKGAVRRCYKL